ncbi:AtpZ/AtpI family protein [Mesotoga sp. B105.6.4]|uniref:AtpZ/AtpI family protein n=1 Tax=Mesotoga sp. B105.6.4 TaxID=1582224 RepID=UPI0021554625|nr:AtpZ/AtpI family protein [Mesotoga sp. B105.6.4]
MKDKRSKIDWTALSSLYQFAVIVIANIMVSGGIGYLLHKYVGMNRLWISFFMLFGAFSGIYNGIRYLMKEAERYDRDKDNDDQGIDNTGSPGNG